MSVPLSGSTREELWLHILGLYIKSIILLQCQELLQANGNNRSNARSFYLFTDHKISNVVLPSSRLPGNQQIPRNSSKCALILLIYHISIHETSKIVHMWKTTFIWECHHPHSFKMSKIKLFFYYFGRSPSYIYKTWVHVKCISGIKSHCVDINVRQCKVKLYWFTTLPDRLGFQMVKNPKFAILAAL